MEFNQDKLDVYSLSVAFVPSVNDLSSAVPRGFSFLIDQLRRAATSICFNIAEGAGEFSQKEKARFYRMAKRSATETVAVIDVLHVLSFVTPEQRREARTVLHRICGMLTNLIRRMTDPSR